jgi:putative SOS response-associated peptidase YedK
METVLNCSNGRLNFYTYVEVGKVIKFENFEIIQPLLDKIELLLQNQQKENWITMEKLDRSKTRLTINNEYSTYKCSQEIENMLNEYIEKMRDIAK